jgi:phage baseplate assembly protein W
VRVLSAGDLYQPAEYRVLLAAVFPNLPAGAEIQREGRIVIMDGGQLYGRGMAFPPHVGPDGRMAWSEGDVNIREAIQIILETEPKERINMPSFGGGLREFLFEPNTVATRFRIQDRITKALAFWEPRITVTSVTVEADPSDDQSAIATIEYRLVATQVSGTVSLRVKLAA